ncbi:Ig-like domain-containing protein, partial [Microcoleus sp. B13-B4]
KLTPALVKDPTNGTIIFNPDGTFNYNPKPGFVGSDTFTYSVSDGAATVPATVTINVTNTAPTANPDSYTVPHDTPLYGFPSVLDNDTDANKDKLTPALVKDPTNGTIIFNPDGTFNYTPNPGFVG